MSSQVAEFGPNQWLVDEIYQQYLSDPNSVDPAWWEFFADYKPADATLPAGAPTDELPGATEPATEPAAAPAATPEATPPAGRSPASDAVTPEPTVGGVPRSSAKPAPRAVPPQAEPVGLTPPTTTPLQVVEPPRHEPQSQVLRGPAARVVSNMEASLTVPTATSVRAVPAKLLIDNRLVINNQLARARGGKVSFTHLIGWAVVQAVKAIPAMNAHFAEVDGKPTLVDPGQVNLGLAIDLARPDGSRQLLVPSIKDADRLDFAQFWTSYEDLVRRARAGKLAVEDFAGTTLTLTNPGTIGTVHSVPRLMAGQGAIIGVGAMDYPAER
ncbi:MAG TPA: 2-oxo acid dehydrogenase subunit E2, partial [Actinomycetes bacterium]|nr:2-oxo acid dehydrogenase subunit E2 [Actinomycetes bacterium]